MTDNNQPVQPVAPSVPKPPTSQIGATANPQTTPKVTLAQAQASGQYKASKTEPAGGSAPITQEGGYYQSRATDLGLMEQSPKETKLPEMSVSLGSQQPGDKMLGGGAANNMLNRQLTQQMQGVGPVSNKEASYGTGGIMKPPGGFQTPNAASYQSGTSLTSTIPNIMADNNVHSAIGNVTQPVSTGVMRAVPKLAPWTAPAEKMNLWDESSVLDNI